MDKKLKSIKKISEDIEYTLREKLFLVSYFDKK